ncbi:MAG: hypothetical protein VYA34_01980 [Myxococcota bacterium]|nr:hypothetical protein [Myxococcota bacterium]
MYFHQWLKRARDLNRALGIEARETKELARLVRRKLKGHRLEPEELQLVNEQLKDLVKMVPLTLLLALPGGALLFLWFEKIFPVSMLPSALRGLVREGGRLNDSKDAPSFGRD